MRLKLAYLIAEFPAQMHSFCLNEVNRTRELGVGRPTAVCTRRTISASTAGMITPRIGSRPEVLQAHVGFVMMAHPCRACTAMGKESDI